MTSTQALVSAAEFRELAAREDTIVVDPRIAYIDDRSRSHRAGYLEAHLPGALFFDLFGAFSDADSELSFTLPPAERFEASARALGIDDDTHVLVYADGWQTWATRVWWLFRYFGHDRVSVLDGGLGGWIDLGYPVEGGEVLPSGGGTFTASPREDLVADITEVEQIVAGTRSGQLVNALPYELFTGELPTHPGVSGRIPSSVNLPWPLVADLETNRFRPAEQISAATAETLAPAGGNVIAYCGGGISATGLIFGLHLAGRDDVKLYDGSLDEWSLDHPLEVGEA